MPIEELNDHGRSKKGEMTKHLWTVRPPNVPNQAVEMLEQAFDGLIEKPFLLERVEGLEAFLPTENYDFASPFGRSNVPSAVLCHSSFSTFSDPLLGSPSCSIKSPSSILFFHFAASSCASTTVILKTGVFGSAI